MGPFSPNPAASGSLTLSTATKNVGIILNIEIIRA